MQMLPQTDTSKAAADAISVRTALMAKMAPEIAPIDLVKIFNGTELPGKTGAPAGGSGSRGGGGGGGLDGAMSSAPSMTFAGAISLLAMLSFL